MVGARGGDFGLKNLDAENANSLLDHFADVGKMVALYKIYFTKSSRRS